MRSLLPALAALFAVPSLATAALLPFEIYYANVNTSEASTLRPSLNDVIGGHTRISYDSGANWPILEAADENPSDAAEIVDFYGNQSFAKVTDRTTNYNREHMWPQSYGFPQSLDSPGFQGFYPRCDLHALYLADSGYNSTRGNRYFATVDLPRTAVETVLNNGVGGGAVVYPGNHNWYASGGDTWEVWNGRRGNAARAIFYMDVRYDGGAHTVTGDPEPDLIVTDNPALINPTTGTTAYMGLTSVLLQWNEQDPPDAQELARMEIVAAVQNNRNPFVDFPEFADCLHTGDCSQVAPINPQNVTALAGPASVTVTWDARPETDLAGYRVYEAPSPTGPFTRVTSSLVTATRYRVTGLTDGTPVYVAVTAEDFDGNESRRSLVAAATPGARTTLQSESFESEPSTDTWQVTGEQAHPATGDYFGRYFTGDLPPEFNVATAGLDGFHLIVGEDTNGTAPLPSDGVHLVQLAPLDITGATDLQVSLRVGALAADVYDTAARAAGDYLRVLVSIDGGPDTLVGQFTKVGANAANGRLGVDNNLDGLADVELASYTALNTHTFTVAGTGDELVVKVQSRFEAGGEQFAYDLVQVSGIAPATGSSVTGWMLLQ